MKRLSPKAQADILDFLALIEIKNNPRSEGKALKGIFKGLWRYRVGDYRIICDIRDDSLTVIAIKIGHRKAIYQ